MDGVDLLCPERSVPVDLGRGAVLEPARATSRSLRTRSLRRGPPSSGSERTMDRRAEDAEGPTDVFSEPPSRKTGWGGRHHSTKFDRKAIPRMEPSRMEAHPSGCSVLEQGQRRTGSVKPRATGRSIERSAAMANNVNSSRCLDLYNIYSSHRNNWDVLSPMSKTYS